MRKLRLLLTDKCDRSCPGCCNNDWDLDSLPYAKTYKGYSEILITGGEPLLFPGLFRRAVCDIRDETRATIYLYTAKTDDSQLFLNALSMINGACVTLHCAEDVESFERMWSNIHDWVAHVFSLRLNVFKGLSLEGVDTEGWKVKKDMEWIKDCPLPEGEEFLRYLDEGE